MSIVQPLSKCALCQSRATRAYKGKTYCALHYTILVKAPATTAFTIPESYTKADPNY